MISIPVAVYNDLFQWQLDLFWHSHKKTYHIDAYKKAHAIIIERNSNNDTPCKSLDWKTDIPFTLCQSYFDMFNQNYDNDLRPINIQVGLLQILHKFHDDQTLELLDCDLIHLRKHPNINIQHNQMYTCDLYENWHMFSKTSQKGLIEKYFKNNGQYYNGGFVPIIATTKTFKLIIEDWIKIHKNFFFTHNTPEMQNYRWCAGMYSLQAACERNHVQMISQNLCYIPGINQLQENYYITHYSIDQIFNKKTYPNNINWQSFPNNDFYNLVKDWKNKSIANSTIRKIFI
jgi:hypothetical protein